MDLKPWLNALTQSLQIPEGAPTDHTIRTLLNLARDAAHEVERPAAPLTTFLVGWPLAGARPSMPPRGRPPRC